MQHEIDQAHELLEAVDRDGALRDAAAKVAGSDRSGTLTRRAGLFGGALGAAALAVGHASPAKAAGFSDTDVSILNFALVLEYLEAAFYKEAGAIGNLEGELALFNQVVSEHESTHVAALKTLLGRQAVKSPTFDFRDTTADPTKFIATSTQLEGTGLSAYKGQAPLVTSYAVLYAALAIHSVEGRHYAWILDLQGANPAPDALDAPRTRDEVLAAVAATGFVTSPLP